MTPINKFSTRRMWRIARFHAKAIRRQIAVYCCASLVIGLLTLTSCYNGAITLSTPIIAFALLLMLWFGPLVFASEKGMAIETMLPATAMEKALFPILYTSVAIPVWVLAPFATVACIGYDSIMQRPHMDSYLDMVISCIMTNPFQTFASTAFVMATCLWGTTFHTRRRATKSAVLTFAAILLCSVSAIIKIGLAMQALYNLGLIGHECISVTDNGQLYELISSLVTNAANCGGALAVYRICENATLAVLIAVLVVGIYRNIKNRQI